MAIVAFLGAAAPTLFVAVGLGFFVASTVFLITRRSGQRGSHWSLAIILGLVATVLVFGSIALAQAYTTVSYGTVGLVARFGGLTGQVFEPGLHWKTPFIDKLVIIPTVVLSYETSDSPTESGSNYTDIPITAQTTDGQQISIKYTVLFRIPADRVVSIVSNVGYAEAVVQNVVKAYSRNLSRLHAQSYTAENLYSGEGIFDYEMTVRADLEAQFGGYGIVLDNFLVRKVDFSSEYVNAIEQKQIAQEAIDTAKYNSEAAEFEKERQIRLSQADAERTKLLAAADAERTKLLAAADAERTKLLAAADAERQRLLAEAEAYGIEKRGEALLKYPTLVQWEFVRNLQDVQWGILPSDGITPFIPLPGFEGGATPALPNESTP